MCYFLPPENLRKRFSCLTFSEGKTWNIGLIWDKSITVNYHEHSSICDCNIHVTLVLSIVVARRTTHQQYSTHSKTLQHVCALHSVSFGRLFCSNLVKLFIQFHYWQVENMFLINESLFASTSLASHWFFKQVNRVLNQLKFKPLATNIPFLYA